MRVTLKQIRANRLRSLLVAILLAIAALIASWFLSPDPYLLGIILIPLSLVVPWLLYGRWTQRYRRRGELLQEPFPPAWEEILAARVAYYHSLTPEERERFQRELMIFLAETPITGVRCDVDDVSRVLIGASAVIPIFGFPAWEYDMLDEILLYPDTFDATFNQADGQEMAALGMVGSDGVFNGVMVLSKPALLQGFASLEDKENVGIHEFAHLIDKATGDVDGVPISLPAECFQPWLRLMRHMLAEEGRKVRDINPYGLTSEEEFLAVASEYFFESPDRMADKHPELYKMLCRIFRQDMRSRLARLPKAIRRARHKRLRRNSPCPCGSGRKYKSCCGRRSGSA